jgi:hypothetical protein
MKVAICDDSIEWAEKIKNYLEKNCDKLGASKLQLTNLFSFYVHYIKFIVSMDL